MNENIVVNKLSIGHKICTSSANYSFIECWLSEGFNFFCYRWLQDRSSTNLYSFPIFKNVNTSVTITRTSFLLHKYDIVDQS